MVSARRTLFFVVLVAFQSSSLFSETSRASAQDKETQLSAAKGFTIEQALNFPYPEETSIVAAPNADRIAWVENKHGVRNIVVAEAPQWKLQKLTNYTKDDGQTLIDLSFSSDGSMIVYTRGGAKNQQGQSPNPDGDPAGAKQAVWIISWSGGAPRKVDMGSAPKFSPDSSSTAGWVGYLKDGTIWLAPTGGGTAIEVFAQGVNTDLEWSPSGKQIAFVSNRSGHSLIPIYDVDKKDIHYIAPTVDRDSYPLWSPDGRYIAFIRSTISFGERGSSLTGPDRPTPWSIMIHDTTQGNVHETWHSGQEANDSLPNLPGNTLLSWGEGNVIIFSSEQEGWQHLYSVSIAGGVPKLLTPGNCEYDYMAYSADRKTILYSSNCEDIDRRHLWQVSVTGGKPQSVTSGTGLEWWPVPTSSGNWIAFLGSDAQHPAAPFIKTWEKSQPIAEKAHALTQLPSDFPVSQLVTPKQVVFKATDGLDIHGQLFLPSNLKQGEKHPAIVHMHGGPLRQLLLG